MATPVILPKFGMTMEQGTLLRWLKAEGEAVAQGEAIAEVETDKVAMEVEAPASGVLLAVRAQPGEVIPVTQVIGYIGQPGEAVPSAEATVPASEASTSRAGVTGSAASPVAVASGAPATSTSPAVAGGGEPVVAPAARRLAREHGIDLRQVRGSGPGGRITLEDVQAAVGAARQAGAAASAAGAPPAGAPAASAGGETPSVADDVAVVALTSTRRTIAERTARSWTTSPHIFVDVDIEMGRVEAVRGDVSVTAYIVWAVSRALQEVSALNATWDGERLLRHRRVHVGVAVALEEGLIVPVVRDAHTKDVGRLDGEIRELAARARAGRLSLEEVSGGTFTVSNLGMYGVDRFTAVIYPPQVGILAVGRVQRRPVARGEAIGLASVASFTVVADHRAVDGAQAARFLQALKSRLEALPGEVV